MYETMNKKTLSVKDIAAMAGTSVATVSRVINQNGRYSKATEEKIRQIINEYGYEPNQLARSLRVKHTKSIGILVPDIADEFCANVIKVVQQELLLQGYMALICNTNEQKDNIMKYARMLQGQKVNGIIYIGNNEITHEIDTPTVYIDRAPIDRELEEDDYFVMIECDNFNGGYLAGRELIKKGAGKICFIVDNRDVSTHRERLKGLRKALAEEGLSLEESQIIEVEGSSAHSGMRAMEKILEEIPETDGVFCATDALAIGALHCLVSNQIAVPQQIRVVGFDDISPSAISYPALTTIRQPIQKMGILAVHCMLSMLNGEKLDPLQRRQKLPVELVVRKST